LLLTLTVAGLTACAGGGGGATTSGRPRPAPTAAPPPVQHLKHYYVSTKGSDAGSGSRKRPWRTIGRAAAKAGPGTVVIVAPGHYRGPVVLGRSGEPGRPIRFVSARRWAARISATATGSLGIVELAGRDVDFVGFDVSGRGGDGTAGIIVPGSYDRVIGNHVHDVLVACTGGTNGGGGIVAGGGNPDYRNHDIQVIGNVVNDVVGTPKRHCVGVQGIYASVARVRIVNNVSYSNGDNCITSWHAASRLTIANNTAVGCPGAGINVSSGESGATRSGNIHTIVVNNIVYRNGKGIVATTDGVHRVGPNRYMNNLVFGSRTDNEPLPANSLEAGAIVSGTIGADPKLRGPRDLYRPSAGSPAIDAGTSIAAPRTDFDGVRRPQGARVDVGAFEWRPPQRPSG
jgi:hypothetical protein